MSDIHLNVLAIIVAVIINMVVGAVYYHPKVLGTRWMTLTGKSMEQVGNANTGYMAMTAMSLIMAVVMAVFIIWTGASTIITGATVGFLAWLGFVLPSNASHHIFEGKPWSLLALNVCYHLITFILIGALLAIWR